MDAQVINIGHGRGHQTNGSEQLPTPANKVAVINLKLQDTETTLGAMLRSMAYIREQLSRAGDAQSEPLLKRHQK